MVMDHPRVRGSDLEKGKVEGEVEEKTEQVVCMHVIGEAAISFFPSINQLDPCELKACASSQAQLQPFWDAFFMQGTGLGLILI